MIPVGAPLSVVWLDPLDLLIDHRSHGLGLDAAYLAGLVARLEAEPHATSDPIVAERRDGRLWVTNGRHRALAHILAKRPAIAAVIVE